MNKKQRTFFGVEKEHLKMKKNKKKKPKQDTSSQESKLETVFGELQAEFDMKRECLLLDKFEKIKSKWLDTSSQSKGGQYGNN